MKNLKFGTYFCTKCNHIHCYASQIGKKHYEFNRKKQEQLKIPGLEIDV